MKVLILDECYPSLTNKYGDVFLHTRVKQYVNYCEVLIVDHSKEEDPYVYEGIRVVSSIDLKKIQEYIDDFQPDFLFVHFYHRKLYPFIVGSKVPVSIWMHGYEGMGWYRRLFNYSILSFLNSGYHVIATNLKQQIGLRKIVRYSNETAKVQFVFVSHWLKKIVEQDIFIKVKHSHVIANPIDEKRFAYQRKDKELRKKILIIKSFSQRMYANDIVAKTILSLSKKDYFHELQFTIIGKGRLFHRETDGIKHFKNVTLIEDFVDNANIPAIHSQYGVFLCPTRQDSQGVSRGEAMSSGLVAIATDNSGVPEFVSHNISGILGQSVADMTQAIEDLYKNEELFERLSEGGSQFIQKKCGLAFIVSSELKLINIQTS